MNPLLKFYQDHGISPVHQHIPDRSAHFARRAALYRQLGLPPSVFFDRRVLEVGPGTGENSRYIASLNPLFYMLVEPNPAAAETLREMGECWEVVEEPIERVRDVPFDVVLCEGLLGLCGGSASALLEVLVRHVSKRGVLVITCIDAISDHAEIRRRALAQTLINRTAPLSAQVETLRPVFAPHLATLKGMTRSVDDWIIDNLLNPASIGPPFSIPEACKQLEGRFEVLGCSPRFLTDWTWYKASKPGNQWAIESYWRQAYNLYDYRYIRGARDRAQNEELNDRCLQFRQRVRDFEEGRGPALSKFTEPIDQGWFGRGQQYLSFVRVDANHSHAA